MYGTKEMYGTDHSVIFSTRVNNTLYITQYNVYVGTSVLTIQCKVCTTAVSFGKDTVLNAT
jgi:hypothetical protein